VEGAAASGVRAAGGAHGAVLSVALRPIARGEVRRLAAAGALLVEVLPPDEYDEEHLPGALHLPLKSLTAEAAARVLERGRPIVVYCWDAL
jgi:rhodanese-related sulfurtransferase